MSETELDLAKLVELLRKMGHDARAPLGSIISTSDMLAEGVYEPLTPKQTRANDRIRRNSRRVLAILDDFITYVKAEVGQIDLAIKPFDTRASLWEWVNQVKSVSAEKGVALNVTIQEDVPSSLMGDVTVIGRAVVPLLWNAVTFTPQGAIEIESDWSASQGWGITLRDSGIGIPVDHIPHIFEPFWRGEERPQVSTAGVGLGLALSAALVKLMNGQILLEETSAQGSIFRMVLPLVARNN